jgi:ABC-type amino acid transport substrate-binding protein
MRAVIATLLLGLAVVLAACTDEARTNHLDLQGRVFIFNPRLATATYVVTLAVRKAPPEGAKVVALFDNPAGGEALRVEQTMRKDQARVDLESEPLRCVKKGRTYTFSVSLLDAAGKELQKVESSITSTLDQSVLPPAPLVIGPAYEPNPALDETAGKLAMQQRAACPP